MNPIRWVVLDRDGVINEESDAFIKSPDEWRPIPGSLEAIAALGRGGFAIAVLTNQSGVGRGLFDLDMLEVIRARMFAAVEEAGGRIDALYFCPHGPEDGCDCRKPKLGLFERFAREHQVNLTGVPAIGDSYRDLQAAWEAGASPILVKTGKGLRTLEKYPDPGCPVFENLHEAAQFLLSARLR
jgi:D-glycero-D-manno-heptose 1,7-bisphosphate phosphatase